MSDFKIPANKVFAVKDAMLRVKYRDVLDACMAQYPDMNMTNGFFSQILFEYGEDFPKIVQALSLAGVRSDAAMTYLLEFELPMISRNLEKNVSAFLALVLANCVNQNQTDYVDFFEPLNEDTVMEWARVFDSVLRAVEARNGDNLLSMAQTYFNGSYNPLENYDMSETETPNITRTTHGEINSKSTTTSEGNSDVYGFNSTNPTPSSKSDSSITNEAKKGDNYSDGTETETGTRTTTRHGNIGVMSSQMLVTSELDLRKFDFMEYVYKCFEEVMFSKVW